MGNPKYSEVGYNKCSPMILKALRESVDVFVIIQMCLWLIISLSVKRYLLDLWGNQRREGGPQCIFDF